MGCAGLLCFLQFTCSSKKDTLKHVQFNVCLRSKIASMKKILYICCLFLWQIYIYTHTHGIGTPCLYRVGPLFAFRAALILRGIDSTRCWKHSSEIWVHIDMIASHSCCRFVSCTFMMRISRSTTSQRCSIGLWSGDCGGQLSESVNTTVFLWLSGRALRFQRKRLWVQFTGNTHNEKMYSLNALQVALQVALTLPSECRSSNRDSSDQARFFQSYIIQIW